jgi:hypothetical protein
VAGTGPLGRSRRRFRSKKEFVGYSWFFSTNPNGWVWCRVRLNTANRHFHSVNTNSAGLWRWPAIGLRGHQPCDRNSLLIGQQQPHPGRRLRTPWRTLTVLPSRTQIAERNVRVKGGQARDLGRCWVRRIPADHRAIAYFSSTLSPRRRSRESSFVLRPTHRSSVSLLSAGRRRGRQSSRRQDTI